MGYADEVWGINKESKWWNRAIFINIQLLMTTESTRL